MTKDWYIETQINHPDPEEEFNNEYAERMAAEEDAEEGYRRYLEEEDGEPQTDLF